LNDQFGGIDGWERYLRVLEDRSPVIQAIGVTDYYSLDTYQRLTAAKAAGRLADCSLIFPNIETRLALGTVKGAWVNLHLLVSPEDERHVEEAKRFMSRLTFEAFEDTFNCTPDELVRLGQRAGAPSGDRVAALKLGSTQFKVDFNQLREIYRSSSWARTNILIAVAGGMDDGISGLREASDKTLRQEVERFAHIIFASSVAQREFWLGLKTADADELSKLYGGLKPCLHGSDGHSHSDAGVPTAERYTWIKGDPTFDALRQACIDPGGRAYVGLAPPTLALSSQVVSTVRLENAPWVTTPTVHLNPGLVAIVGARGSGKTALADVIAAGCDALPNDPNRQSFLYRAHDFLHGASVTLDWEVGDAETRSLDGSDPGAADRYPRARYLSQQFVEELCASDGMTDALLREIERIVFDAHDVSHRDGAVDFDDLLEIRATRHRQARAREEVAMTNLSERIGTELEKIALLPSYIGQVTEKTQLIARHTEDRSKLVAKGSEERVARLGALTQAAERVRSYVRFFNLQEQQLLTMQDEVTDFRTNQAPESLRETQARHAASGIKGDDWNPFLIDFTGPVDKVIKDGLASAQKNGAWWKGTSPPASVTPDAPLIDSDAELDKLPLALLEAEINRLQRLVSIDRKTSEKFAALSKRIVEENDLLARLKIKLTDATGAKARANDLVAERGRSYIRVFEAIIAEQQVLAELYAPIRVRLSASSETLQKLSFSVTRVADVKLWATAGEGLLDLRRQGPFRGSGALQQLAEASLKGPWESGDAHMVAAAMKAFREAHQDALLAHAQVPKSQQVDYRSWSKRFAQWLYSTDHISIHYGVDYDGVDIRNLSPGTRGIVLLLLYLALDDVDDRPLIIDQPEESLDPKSIFDELVGLFLAAKSKRQVIMVTHNANLVVNTDADQVIVASVGPHTRDALPPITYLSGGLENGVIRKAVCDILEGGERAFRERARRLRVRLDR
jgi:energy-coupling factor transporter ATP-binding protein EcfA2